jgi:SnoaL-like protein
MTERKPVDGLNFDALRLGIERRDPDLVLGFYAEDAHLSIVNVSAPQALPFELRGKAEIAKHLRAVFGQGASHRVEQEEVVGEGDGMRFREVCEYPDGGWVVVETTLEMRGGQICRQVDMVAWDVPADRIEEIGPGGAKGERQ